MKKNSMKVVVLFFLGMAVSASIFFLYKKDKLVSQRANVTTSFYPLYFFSKEIGGDKLIVSNITPVGAEPHDYEPTLKDIVKIKSSKLLVLNGGGIEPWAAKIKSDLEGGETLVIETGQDLFSKTYTDEEGESAKDPHVWLSPKLAQELVERIFLALVEIDSKNKGSYSQNRVELVTKLKNLDKKYKTGLANCRTKNIVTAHEAFGYLASEYGLNQVAISGLSPDDEPSLRELAEVADYVKEQKIKYIFFESLISPELSDTIAREVGAQTLVLNPLEGLSQDEIDSGKDYFSIMEENLVNLRIALECT